MQDVHVVASAQVKTPPLRFTGFKDGWLSQSIGEVFHVKAGGDVSPEHVSFEPQGSFIYPIYANAEKRKGLYGYSDIYSVDEPSVTIAGRGVNIGIAHARDHKFYAIVRLLVLTPKRPQSIFFFEHALNRINLFKESTGVPQLTGPQVSGYDVSFPTLPEQTKIAGFLSAVDGKIQQLTRKKALLEQYKKGVMQQLFTQEIRFTRANGKAFPEWEEKRLGDICTDISYGMNAAAVEYDGENKYLRITDIDENSHEFLQTGLTSPGNALEDKYVLREGDLLFARTGASVGKSYLYKKKDGKVYFAGFLIRFHVKEGVPEFIYAQTLTTEYGRWVTENSMRSGQPGLNAEEYKSRTVHFPCLEEQQRIAGFLSALDGRVAAVQQQLEGAVRWKKGLLQQMFV